MCRGRGKLILPYLYSNNLTTNYLQYKERYEIVMASRAASTSQPPASTKGKAASLKKLIREVISSGDDESDSGIAAGSSFSDSYITVEPWRAGFNAYIDTIEADTTKGMSTVEWWGVSISIKSVYSATD